MRKGEETAFNLMGPIVGDVETKQKRLRRALEAFYSVLMDDDILIDAMSFNIVASDRMGVDAPVKIDNGFRVVTIRYLDKEAAQVAITEHIESGGV